MFDVSQFLPKIKKKRDGVVQIGDWGKSINSLLVASTIIFWYAS